MIAGIASGCEQAGCALIGGETAEMPGMYPEGEYDLAGFAVGVVEKSKVIDGQTIVPGDVVLGLASSGAHSNGYSLVRKLIDVSGIGLKSDFHGRPFADAVMAPTRIYVKPLLALMEALSVKGMAHITGGGITGNLPRCLPEDVAARVDQTAGRGRRCSTGCSRPAMSRRTKCCAPSTAASACAWSSPQRMRQRRWRSCRRAVKPCGRSAKSSPVPQARSR